MNRQKAIFSKLCIFAILICISRTVVADTIVLASDEWCPYNCAPGSDKPGFMVEIATKVFAEAGHQVDYKIVPWSRALDEARSGKLSGVIGAYKSDAPDFVFPARAPAQSETVFFAKTGEIWRYDGEKSLAAVAIAGILDYSYTESMDKYITSNKADPLRVQLVSGDDGLDKNVKKLLAGRVRVVLEDRAVMRHYLSTHGLQDKIVAVGAISAEDVFIAFSPALKNSKDYAHILSVGIEKMQASGELQRIIANY